MQGASLQQMLRSRAPRKKTSALRQKEQQKQQRVGRFRKENPKKNLNIPKTLKGGILPAFDEDGSPWEPAKAGFEPAVGR
jgi:hypothetical protein